MKQINVILLGLMLPFYAQAQKNDLKLGTRLSLGQSEIQGTAFENRQAGLLIGIGGTADYQINKWFGLMGDAFFIKKGVAVRGTDQGGVISGNQNYIEKFNFYQAEFPILAKLRIGSENFGFRLFAGPSFGFNLLGTRSKTYENDNFDEDNGYRNRSIPNLNVMETGLVYGLGIELKARDGQMLFADLRNNFSRSTVGIVDNKELRLNNFYLSVGWLF